jgi:ubiquinone/menaquinone biosynthesis C-methylase UbiE
VSSDYIHGYSRAEQHRLAEQTAVLAPNLFRGWDLAGCHSLLELGCGVGAELAHIRGLWPGIALTGIDLSEGHLGAARALFAERAVCADIGLVRGDAYALPFADGTFDAAITVWMLEHVANPRRVLGEALRVLSPHGRLICTEVDNDSFGFAPEVPAIRDWWDRFNRCQRQAGGDPWVGRRLADIARSLGARDIATETLPIVSSQFEPPRRAVLLDYLEDLLLSGAELLTAAGEADRRRIAALRGGFAQAREDTEIEFRYYAVRLTCRPPRRSGAEGV